MFSTIKGKIIFFVTLVMVVCAVVNIYFIHRDVGDAMLVAQEKSAVNILHSMDVIIKDAYHPLLSDKQAMTQLKRRQLQSAARMIESVFTGYRTTVMKGRPQAEAAVQALAWLESAPFEGIDYFIIDSASQILASSRNFMTTEAWKSMKDAKYRNLCEIMCYEKLRHKEDYATFMLPAGDGKTRPLLAHFLPLDQWEYTIALAVDISDIEAEAQTRLEKILSSLNEFSRQLNITKNGFVYMFDADDTILIPPPDHIRNDIHLSGNLLTKGRIYDDIKSASESETAELQIVSSNDPDQNPMMVYCRYFKPLKWYISVFVPLNEINTPARILVTRQSLIITALFMAGLGVVFLGLSVIRFRGRLA